MLAKTSLPTVTLLSLNAFSNSALFVYTVSLYVTDVKDEQLENTLYSILVTLSGIVMDVKPAQSLNALLSMVFTLSGRYACNDELSRIQRSGYRTDAGH